jgi:hypothetical protein
LEGILTITSPGLAERKRGSESNDLAVAVLGGGNVWVLETVKLVTPMVFCPVGSMA